ncbi:excalibur calcium-binding domain-containing protein [Arenivirga flava]|nr:excalibur calcium-binding domain-containing protein [Arenivirga flava]
MAAQAGWYDDATVPGQERYWDGEAWTEQVQPKAQPHPQRRKRAVRLPFVIAIGVGALLLGVAIGGAGSDPTRSAEYLAVSEELVVAEDASAELAEETAALEEELDALSDEVAQLAEQQQAVVDAETAVAARETAADERDAELQQRESDLQGRETAVQTRESSVSQPAPPAAQPSASAPSAYYENCTAARNAGAAPVRSGDPGYGRHLDRDGDGVGCE